MICNPAKQWRDSQFGNELNSLRSLSSAELEVGTAGFEPATPCTPSKCASRAAPRPEILNFQYTAGSYELKFPFPFLQLHFLFYILHCEAMSMACMVSSKELFPYYASPADP
jgi:hypothetical protein